jgi:hypothetical protein
MKATQEHISIIKNFIIELADYERLQHEVVLTDDNLIGFYLKKN